MWQFSVLLLLLVNHLKADSGGLLSYEEARKEYLVAEEEVMTGGLIKLNNDEAKVNDLFMQYKLGELSHGFKYAEENAAAMHFFKAKRLIDRSKVFSFLKSMPKGAVLHLHNTASVSARWVVNKMSYMPGMVRCVNSRGVSILSFRRAWTKHGCHTSYVVVAKERENSAQISQYNAAFEKLINLYTPLPEVEFPSITSVWTKFQDMFTTLGDAIHYVPAFRAYHWQMLEELYSDNVMYAEIRTSFKQLYDSSGRTFPRIDTIKELLAINEKFTKLHPNFLGIKLIYAVYRGQDAKQVEQNLEEFRQWHQAYPNFVIGFDLVGQEDKGKPLYSFMPILNKFPSTAKFFFHAGETNWFGASSDTNLLDALLLNTTRIGHGYALAKHPILMNAAQRRQVAIEVNPISNQVLHLLWDMRNHPASQFMAYNVPIVICNDDPGYWNAKGLSYDFYYAIMSLAPNYAGLKVLKALVWNSIRYSMLSDKEREGAYKILEIEWSNFTKKVLQGSVF